MASKKVQLVTGSLVVETPTYPVWKVGDIISVDESHFKDYLLIVEANGDEHGGDYLIQPISSVRLNNEVWESDPALENPEKVTADNLSNYKLEC
jgi:hypothetical protein